MECIAVNRCILTSTRLTLSPFQQKRCFTQQKSKTRSYIRPVRVHWMAFPLGFGALAYYVYHQMHIPDFDNKTAKNWQITLYRKMPLKTMSRWWGQFNDISLPVFLRKPILGLYIWMFNVNLAEAQVENLKDYRNLGEFFRRTLKPDARVVDGSHILTSPADGKILHYGHVENGILEQVKGMTYSLSGFFGPNDGNVKMPTENVDSHSGVRVRPGNRLYHCVIYLAPGDYHRFHSPADWTIQHRRHFPDFDCSQDLCSVLCSHASLSVRRVTECESWDSSMDTGTF